jgi:hypothetical protein
MKIQVLNGYLTATNKAHIKKMARMSGFIGSICNDINAPVKQYVKVNRTKYIFTNAGQDCYNLEIIQNYVNTIGDICKPHSSFHQIKITK